MTNLDQTRVLPRQRAAPAYQQGPVVDRWHRREPQDGPPESGGAAEQRALAMLAWLIPTIAAVMLGLVRLPWPGLSNAELAVWGFARTPSSHAADLLGQISPTVAPYFVFMHVWTGLVGTSEFALRLPSVVAMAAAAGMCSVLSRRLVGARGGLIAGLLFAVVPAVSRYGQNAGPEAITIAAAVFATLALVWQFDEPDGTRRIGLAIGRWLGYAFALAILGLASGPALVLLLAAHGTTVLFMRPARTLAWIGASILGSAPAAWLFYLAQTVWHGTTGAADVTVHSISGGLLLLFGAGLVGGAVVGIGMLGVSLRRPTVVFALWAGIPLAVLPAWHALAPVSYAPAIFVSLAAWTGSAAAALRRYPVTRGLAAVAVIGLLSAPTQQSIRRADGHDQATRSLAAVLASRMQTGDAIVYGPTDAAAQTARDIVARYVPAAKRPADVLATTPPRTAGRLYAIECPDVAKCLGTAARVWVIRVDGDLDPLDGMPAGKDGALRVGYAVHDAWTFRGLTLTLFVRGA